ncbi:MAG: isocitrate lyase/PEP mutase family protein [Candidatus Omnitrophica bacterium]|nr:isocitrate lyase/PEP mutase family protein [Candidatus Omnitrophota bacterium]MCF7876734.1 isocitrate lyase/PEP mutase family protein [Candidatus Omnitrophota bacterium]MCF7891467.1 isocitrate lyase/PEP mutase family protein [Candidatus Omnitrophota bacterium]MCF7895403.1 isocitrate lyase/PEP mutase family protein [Candidatus Omnitrophota bacterium]MCF7897161.1 isocitrate lyase/PEP mutase family protein [Candidatus Omnitrophota bacterium]
MVSSIRNYKSLKGYLKESETMSFVGVYDVFSAKLAIKEFKGIFLSGFSFSASFLGMPDTGCFSSEDMIAFVKRLRTSIPDAYLLVDCEDGFGDEEKTVAVVKELEDCGVSAVILEDQKRPRKCGQLDNKLLSSCEAQVSKLKAVIKERRNMFIIARTDAADPDEAHRRVVEYSKCGVDAIMMEGMKELSLIRKLRKRVNCHLVVNKIYGGKTPNWSEDELYKNGVSIVIYSTVCLFAAQYAIQRYLNKLKGTKLIPSRETVSLVECNRLFEDKKNK